MSRSSLGVMYGRVRPLGLEIASSSAAILDSDLLKAHCAVDGDALDDLLSIYEQAAIAWAEDEMRRTLLARSHSFVISDFPRCGSSELILPRGLCQSIEGVQYVSNGEVTALTDYQSDLTSENGARLMPPINGGWPSIDQDAVRPVVINYTAGWEASTDVPAKIKHALMFAVADMLEVRGVADLTALMGIAASGKTFDVRAALISKYVINLVY